MKTTYTTYTILAATAPVSNTTDPYQPYSLKDGNPDKGKDHPIVPEPASYGLFFVGLILVALVASRYLNRRVTKSL